MVSALRDYTSGPTQTSAQTTAVSREAKSVVNDPNASKADKLYARAVLVSEEAEANLAQATYASELWQALTVLDPQDGNAAFNYAYWLQQKFVKTNQATPHDWRLVSDAYAKAGRLEVGTAKNDSIPNYWGNALANEAEALKEQDDLAGARVVWNQAGDKYAQALAIKADAHDAASNWGLVLLLEAQAIKDSAPDEAEALLAKARGLLERHRDMREAGAKKVAYNLACVYALQNQAGLAVAQLEVCRLSGQLVAGASHWRTDPDLGPIRQSPEYLAWKQQHFPNE